MLTVHRPLDHDRHTDSWIGPAPWIVTPPPGPMALWALSRDRRFNLPPTDWPYPLVVSRAQGTIVEDVDGNRFLDFNAGAAVCSTGHGHAQVVRAVEQQAGKLIHAGKGHCAYEPMIALTEKLAGIAPGRDAKRVLLANSGTEAAASAVGLALHCSGRKTIIAFDGAWHLKTLDIMSQKSGRSRRLRTGGLVRPAVRCMPYGDIAALKDLLNKKNVAAQEVAAIFVEPILGGGCCIIPPADFLAELRSLCSEYGILLVVDESHTGMGRTGKMFCCDHFGVEPDVILLGDGLAGGMPLGAVIARDDIFNGDPNLPGSVSSGNPVSCAAALATIRVLEKHFLDHTKDLSSVALGKLKQIADGHRCLASPRGMGLLLAVDVVRGRRGRMPAPHLRDRIVNEAFCRGLLLLGCSKSGICLTPPLCINRVQLEVGLDVFEEVVATVSA